MADLPLHQALSSVLAAAVTGDRRGLLTAARTPAGPAPARRRPPTSPVPDVRADVRAAGRLAPVLPLRPPSRPGPGPDHPQAA